MQWLSSCPLAGGHEFDSCYVCGIKKRTYKNKPRGLSRSNLCFFLGPPDIGDKTKFSSPYFFGLTLSLPRRLSRMDYFFSLHPTNNQTQFTRLLLINMYIYIFFCDYYHLQVTSSTITINISQEKPRDLIFTRHMIQNHKDLHKNQELNTKVIQSTIKFSG